ncbi:uncharacterized protein [Diadema antillarum]|uniref:uncharacterized protein n=1 Tax=Diadema antillarum TaxID=105358 RepID=UPI003A881190
MTSNTGTMGGTTDDSTVTELMTTGAGATAPANTVTPGAVNPTTDSNTDDPATSTTDADGTTGTDETGTGTTGTPGAGITDAATTSGGETGTTGTPGTPGATTEAAEATETPGATEDPGATNDPDATAATEEPGTTETPGTPGTEIPTVVMTTEEVVLDEVTLEVTGSTVTYPDDKKITVGGGALVTSSVTVSVVNGTIVDGESNWKFLVFAADDDVTELATPIEAEVPESYVSEGLGTGESFNFAMLNVTLNLEDVTCNEFTKVCVRVEPHDDAEWMLSSEGSTDTQCDTITCESAASALSVSCLLVALALFISRWSVY